MSLERRLAVCVLIGLTLGAAVAVPWWGRDGLEVSVWIFGSVIGGATLLLTVTSLRSRGALSNVRGRPTSGGRAVGSAAARVRWSRLRQWLLSVGATLVSGAVVVVLVGLVQTSDNPQDGPVVVDPTASAPAPPTLAQTGDVRIVVQPVSVVAGGTTQVSGTGFAPGETVRVELFPGDLTVFDGPYVLTDAPADSSGALEPVGVTIPAELCCAGGTVRLQVTGRQSHAGAELRLTLQ